MVQNTSFPLSVYCLKTAGGWDKLTRELQALGLDGIEAIADPDDLADDVPLSLVKGDHMTFYADWVDFWRQDEKSLLRRFNSWEEIEGIYRGTQPEDLMRHFSMGCISINPSAAITAAVLLASFRRISR